MSLEYDNPVIEWEMNEVARLAAERVPREKCDVEDAVREEINDRGCAPFSTILGPDRELLVTEIARRARKRLSDRDDRDDRDDQDSVDVASIESFPASDPPAWNS